MRTLQQLSACIFLLSASPSSIYAAETVPIPEQRNLRNRNTSNSDLTYKNIVKDFSQQHFDDDVVSDADDIQLVLGGGRALRKKARNPHDARTVTLDGVKYTPYVFAKPLAHDSSHLMPMASDVDVLVKAAQHKSKLFHRNLPSLPPLSPVSERKLEGIFNGKGHTHEAAVKVGQLVMSSPPRVDSVAGLCEVIEVQWQAKLRDISFEDYTSNAMAQAAIADLNVCAAKGAFQGPLTSTGKVTAKNLFRGRGIGETSGPYVSQFLLRSFKYGSLTIDQEYPAYADDMASTTIDGWLAIQRGATTFNAEKVSMASPKHTWNGRVLGSEVHMDALYQFYYNAACQVQQRSDLAMADVWSSSDLATTTWLDAGGPDLLGAVAAVTTGALRHAWYNKWNLHLRVRPEVAAMRYAQMKGDTPAGAALRALAPEDFLEALEDYSGELLLGLYPEGSPTHPAYPAGHAVVAGAATTVLKAFTRTHDASGKRLPWPSSASEPVLVADGSDELATYTGSDANDMTIIGELNKLASNVALGRDWAAVHYRSDSDLGILLGEAYALTYLRRILWNYPTEVRRKASFFVETFHGARVRVTPYHIKHV